MLPTQIWATCFQRSEPIEKAHKDDFPGFLGCEVLMRRKSIYYIYRKPSNEWFSRAYILFGNTLRNTPCTSVAQNKLISRAWLVFSSSFAIFEYFSPNLAWNSDKNAWKTWFSIDNLAVLVSSVPKATQNARAFFSVAQNSRKKRGFFRKLPQELKQIWSYKKCRIDRLRWF